MAVKQPIRGKEAHAARVGCSKIGVTSFPHALHAGLSRLQASLHAGLSFRLSRLSQAFSGFSGFRLQALLHAGLFRLHCMLGFSGIHCMLGFSGRLARLGGTTRAAVKLAGPLVYFPVSTMPVSTR